MLCFTRLDILGNLVILAKENSPDMSIVCHKWQAKAEAKFRKGSCLLFVPLIKLYHTIDMPALSARSLFCQHLFLMISKVFLKTSFLIP